MRGLLQANRKIRKAKTVIVSGHVNPDGDSIGSLLSLGLGLEELGKKVFMLSPDGVPKKYRGLPGARRIKKRVDKKADLAISVDCSTKEMLGPAFDTFREAGCILEIDHHEVRSPFGDIALIDAGAPAVGEVIYILLRSLKAEITSDIAQNILTSLIVETNSFRLPNVRPLTFKVCSELVGKGVDFYRLVDTVFWSYSKQARVLSGLCLSRCKFSKGGKLAWTIIRRKDFESVGGKDEDVDPVADEIRTIKEVKIAVFFREKDGGNLRVSLRSKNGINAARLAERYGGGGHHDVAGCVIPNTKAAMREFLARAKELLEASQASE